MIIIGGGVFGLAIGWFLARQGQAVTILEQGQVGHGATWAAAGMLMPWKLSNSFSQALFDLQCASREMWPDFATELTSAAGLDLDYQTNGRYFVALSQQAATRLHRQFQHHQALNFPVEWLTGAELRQRAPYLGSKTEAAIFTPMAHHVDNRQVVEALHKVFLHAGGTLREQTPALEVVVTQQQVRGVRTAAGLLQAETVIVAAGAWSGQLPGLPTDLPKIKPRKGQTVVLQMSAAQPLISVPVLGPVYLVPRADGRLIVGTTVEREAGFDTQSTAGGVYHILRKAMDIVPQLDGLPLIELSAGLRPTGPNRLPVLGLTNVKGLILATGGHSYGILLSPVIAKTITHLALTAEVPKLIGPFTPLA